MESLLLHLISHIKEAIPTLSMVDEDCGQLEALDNDNVDRYPLTFPAVLIDTPEVEWSNTARLSQQGTAKVNVRLVIDCYDDTHYASGTVEGISTRHKLVQQLHRALQGYRPADEGELIRVSSKFYTFNHGIKVYDTVYSVAVYDPIRQTTLIDGPVDGRKPSLKVGFRPFGEEW